MKRHWTILYAAALILFTGYVLLDTFVITRVYSVVEDRQTESSAHNNDSKTAENSLGSQNAADSGTEKSDQDSQGAENSGSSGQNDNTQGGSVQNNNTQDSDSGTAENSQSGGTESSGDEQSGTAEPLITDNSYDDGQIRITITQYRKHDTEIYAADIVLSSADYLKTALAQNSYGKNVTDKTSSIAEQHDAILAVNGDYYGVQERGYVLRNGVLYRDKADDDREDLVIYQDGSFAIINESDVSAQTLLEQGAEQILSFGPALAENGEIVISEEEEVGKAMASNPRTAIAILGELHYLFLVSDGRTDESAGLTLYELAEAALELGAQTVYNLDGGGSSTLWFNGEVINRPTSGGRIHERSVSDIVYIGY